MPSPTLAELSTQLRDFARARDWEQFHTPKNLALSLMIEAAEVAEHFQWTKADKAEPLSAEQKQAVAHEIGDTLLYLLRLADVLGIDPAQAAADKMVINAARYPVDKSYGTSAKYDRL